jgi:hypothetical protein
MRTALIVLAASTSLAIQGCEKKQAPAAPKASGTHTHSDGTTHTDPEPGHSAAPPIPLGQTTSNGFTIVATRDAGNITPGGEAPIDVTVTGAKVTAVRFWVGTEDAAGSVKARADIENKAEPDRWHTHAEVPDPLPVGSKLWVEIESDGGQVTTVSFDLKM